MPATKLGFKFGGTSANTSTDLGETFVRRDYFERKPLYLLRWQSGVNGAGYYDPNSAAISGFRINAADAGTGLTAIPPYPGIATETLINSDDWIDVSMGVQVGAAVRRDGTLWVWGGNRDYSLGLGDTTTISDPSNNRNVPTQSGSATNWKKVSVAKTPGAKQENIVNYGNGSGNATLAIKQDGTLWGWGRGYFSGSGLATLTTPTQIGSDSDWKEIWVRYEGGYALKDDGRLYSWGVNSGGRLGIDSLDSGLVSNFAQIGSSKWRSVSTYFYAGALGVGEDGKLYQWGECDSRIISTIGYPQIFGSLFPNMPNTLTKVAGYVYNFVVLDSAGQAWAWKWNNFALSNRTLRNISPGKSFKDVIFDDDSNVARVYLLDWDGNVYMIDNAYYSYDSFTLTKINGDRKYQKIAVGVNSVVGLRSNS